MKQTEIRLKLLKKLALQHEVALTSSEAELGAFRAAFRSRILEASAGERLPLGQATASPVAAIGHLWGLRPLVAAGVALLALVGAGTTVHRLRHSALRVQVAPEPLGSPRSKPTASVSLPAADPCSSRLRAAGALPLIDDFEDKDSMIASLENRVGYWSIFKDSDSVGSYSPVMPTLRTPATRKNRYALHVAGGELLNWGAVVQFAFQPACYDVSRYAGVTFSAKGPGRVFVGMRVVDEVPTEYGGTCKQECYNTHQKKVNLSARWQTYAVLWGEMRQRGYNAKPLDVTRSNGLAFLIQSSDTPYDLWIDDVTFVTP